MASEASNKDISSGAFCRFCLKHFADLVSWKGCAHRYCKACVDRYLPDSSCLMCKGAEKERKSRPNWPLANVKIVKREEEQKAKEEIVCKEEETPAALGYGESREQQGHGEFSMDETFRDRKVAGSRAAGASNGSKGRGISWGYKETLDLLAIWGEQKIQEQLRSSHRNIDFFEYIAQEMTARGHRRNAVECHSKTKTLRLKYKRVIGHNSRPGSSKVTCPFYKQLHRILRGDASVRPKWVSQSLSFQAPPPPQQEPALDPPVSEEPFSPGDLNIMDIRDSLKEESMDDMGDGTWTAQVKEEGKLDVVDVVQAEEEGSNGGRGNDLDSQGPQVTREAHSAPDTVEPPGVLPKEAELPATQFSRIRNKKKRERAEIMFHLFMAQAREDSEKEREEITRDRVLLARFLKAFEQDAAESREERRQCLEAMRANCDMLQGIVRGLSQLTDAIAGRQQGSAGNQARPPLHLANHKENFAPQSRPRCPEQLGARRPVFSPSRICQRSTEKQLSES